MSQRVQLRLAANTTLRSRWSTEDNDPAHVSSSLENRNTKVEVEVYKRKVYFSGQRADQDSSFLDYKDNDSFISVQHSLKHLILLMMNSAEF